MFSSVKLVLPSRALMNANQFFCPIQVPSARRSADVRQQKIQPRDGNFLSAGDLICQQIENQRRAVELRNEIHAQIRRSRRTMETITARQQKNFLERALASFRSMVNPPVSVISRACTGLVAKVTTTFCAPVGGIGRNRERGDNRALRRIRNVCAADAAGMVTLVIGRTGRRPFGGCSAA